MKHSHSSHPPADAAFSLGLRRLAWFNIVLQATFPLATTFTPLMAVASEQYFLRQPAPLSAQRTQVYTLSAGETVTSVARKYHLSLGQLRELNQFRTFARGFDHLQPGDELDVPVAPLPEVRWDDAPATSVPGQNNEDMQAQQVAGYATRAGSFLAGSAKSDAAASMARGMATGEVGGTLQQWLSHFGTARVQLDADKNFSLKNSQFDLLMPLYDQGDNLMFTQGSLHRTDSRTQANLGAGWRHFTPTYMLGGNLFGDYDLSRDHARAGAGVEYWRNFLKLSANGYMRLTGWKDSPDLVDYQERPANGWDVRAQGWMPSLPQLGGKLTYEQYYGNEVALFGVDARQKNPHAITVGINYTPVPLITLGAERRQGQSGKSDTRLTMGMNYQLGVPWRTQVDPTSVAAMRSLSGSRYDLVERNNNIVLEYRKKEVIRLHTAGLVTGHPGEQKSLGVSVTSTYGLSRIDWDAQALSAAGGRVVQDGGSYAVVLPAYQNATQAVNTYTVSGVAVDVKGNRSDRSDTQVMVQAPEVDKGASTFTPESSVVPADGKSVQVLTLTLRDGNNQPVDLDVKDISLNSSTRKSAAVSALTRKSPGVYTVTVTAGTDNETVTLTPVVGGIALSPARVTVVSTLPDGGQSVFTAGPETIVADNTAVSTLTLVAKDAQGNALTGLKDSLTFTAKDSSGKAAGGALTESPIVESSTKGTYTATLKGAASGRYTIVPEYNRTVIGSLSATVTLTAGSAVQAGSAIKTDATTYASGADMTVTVTLKDAQGNAVTGASSSLTAEAVTVQNATLKSGSGWKDNGDGTYTATYTATTAGTGLKATVKASGWSGAAASEAYAITAGSAVQAGSGIRTDATTYASGADMTVTVTLKDAQGNAVTGASSSLTAEAVTVQNATLKSGSGWKDNGDGTYTATYTATTAGTGLKATVKASGWSGAAASEAYAITAGSAAQAGSGIRTDATTYASGADMTVTVTLKDAQGNAVTGASSSLTAEAVTVQNATLKSGSGWKDNGDGTYTATYTATTAGTGLKATVKASGWSGAAASEAYAITAGSAAQAGSGIRTDATTYASGADMTVTVTLKDAQGNAVTGASSSLTAEAVTVQNATLKSGSGWKDNGDGTYTATYTATTAGTGLKATVKASGWSGAAASEAYAITAGSAVQAGSAIKTDATTYASGADMTVTVTLKDAQGNAVTGASSSLTAEAVTVQNATLKSGSGWKDNGDGTYTATYTATTAGTGLKATVKASGWSGAAASEAYAITAGSAVQAGSAIKTDATTYASGADMTVTVTLKDAQGNAVTGASSSLTAEAVTVQNATLKSGSGWKDNGDGTYTATYTATTAGTGLKATVKASGWSGAAASEAYAITAGSAVQAGSAIKTDATTYASGADMTVTVTLKDAQGNAVTGASSSLTAEAVTVQNATLKSGSGWKDNGDGTYTATYTATTAGTGLKATVKASGWSGAAASEAYAITAGSAAQAGSGIRTDATTYASGADMTVTVTLKDAQGNAVTGASSSLTAEAVTVQNATLKSGSGWKDNGDGTYTATYTATTAGTGLKATVKASGWSGAAASEAYAITAGSAAQAGSGIRTDATTYASGADMTVTVTLKDAQGNAVTGASSSLTAEAVTVQNATLKSGSGWKDNGDGTYTATYTATTAGTGLKATVKASGWSGAAASEAYAITAGSAAQAGSGIRTDATTYASGADMTVTVTLKDAQGNAVTGASSSLTAEAVTVQNATLKSGSGWKDNGDGTYTATYTATTAGTGLKATVKASGWSGAAASEAYAITAGSAAQAGSGIRTDATTYASGADMTVTVTLKDAQGNAVTGASSSLTAEAVTVQNATLKSGSGWKDNGDGTYTATYTATTAGTGLKATVKASGWSGAAASEAYAITAGSAAQAGSGIRTDATTYASGADMTVTVTLKDAQGNAVTGASSSLTAEAVTVQNATLKSGSGWKDNGDGTYTATYTATTAGTGLKATVKASGWSGAAASEAYAITAGSAVQAGSAIKTDATTYASGADMTVTVTLKDAQGNAVTGASSSLTAEAVTVQNATLKSGSGWKDNGDGTYTATYTATTAGTGLKATVKASGWSGAAASEAYAITAGSAAQAGSAIKTDATTYASGADMTVTVTLKDAQGNAVTGASSSLTAEAVTVQNATLKSGSGWKDNGDGTYTATYTATTAGTGLKATVKASGWSGAAASEAYAITAGSAAQAGSGIRTDATTYASGADMTVTVTLKDAQGNAVTGASSSLTAEAVTVQNATLKSGSGWKDNGDGTYTATYTATTAGTGLKATVKASGWSGAAASEAYAITAGSAAQAGSGIRTDATTYASGADMTVTVTLKDAQGNAVTGASSSLTAEAVTVQNATLKSGSGWKDNGDGTYTATYTATTAGTGLKATVKASGWSGAAASEAYAITAGSAAQAGSGIRTDATTYASGADMTVTVTLKDAQGNAVTGASSSLTAEAVTVQNATLKSGSGWKDNGDGTYTATYTATTAGTGLKATVKASGWSGAAASEAYAITAGSAAQAGSGIRTDATTYASGADMTVTVTLKDAQGNAVTGASSSLTAEAVTVQNATLKSGSGWKDNGDGTYTATYTATTAGTGLKATVKASGWSGAAASEAYAITAGSAVQAGSAIKTDATTYASGADMTVTVTLKDAQGNAVTGASSSLTAEAVTVQNATLKSGSGWKDNGDGTYTATYTATTAGTGLKATVKASGWSGAAASEAYAITAGSAAQAGSGIRTDATTYASGADMTVTVTLKDAQGNAVTGASSSLTAEAVTVQNATLKSGSGWKDNGDGTYTATYTATTAGTGLKATVKASGWSGAAASEAYAITAGSAAQAGSGIRTDATTYASGADMTVTVTLKDAQGNAVTGASSSLTAEAVTVQNATLKSGSGWKDNGDGTYTATYTATTAGTGLKATVKASGWSGAAASEAYAITAGSAVQAGSAIKTDATTYASGADMTVTVTLKDAQGNAVTGASSSLTAEAVTVQNATLKSGSGWKDNGDGTYTATYTATTAGTGLKATVKASGWSGAAASEAYAITAGSAVQAGSAIKTDATTYASGADMTVTVTLKDAQGNAVTGASSSLTAEAVTVQNATLKSGSGWKDNGDGTYTATYTATTAGTGLKATVKASGWSGAAASEAYAITAGSAAQAGSGIRTDATTYASGADMTVTVTLKDAQGNAVTGASSSLTAEAVTVQNATLKSGSGWKDNGDGTYTATYTATTAGTGLKATVKASGWSGAAASEAYAITAGSAVQAGSAIKTDATTYASGADMTVTVTLKDAQGNAVTGASSSLTAEAVTVQNATLKSGSGWKDNGDGTYTATYTATTAGTGLKATVKASGWSGAAASEAYVITEPVTIKDVSVNGYTFAKDAGFPTTGFKGAEFTLELSSGSASDYDWTTDAPSWVSVSAGVVSFTGQGTGDKVTITGTPKSGGRAIAYSFTLGSWFINNGGAYMNWTNGAAYCAARSGYGQPTVQQLNGSGSFSDGTRGTLGGLWSEWGNLTKYTGAGFSGTYYWSSEQKSSGNRYVIMYNGEVYYSTHDYAKFGVVCRQGL